MAAFTLAREDSPTDECQWGAFQLGSPCTNRQTWVLLDLREWDDHGAFHSAHLCDEHAEPALAISIGHPDACAYTLKATRFERLRHYSTREPACTGFVQ